MKPFNQFIKKIELGQFVFFDGGTGTHLQAHGLQAGELPEVWNLTHPEVLIDLHRAYLEAGCNILKVNTFGANGLKYPKEGDQSLQAIIEAAFANGRKAISDHLAEHPEAECYLALDIGPTGKLLKPMGDLDFEDAVAYFAEIVRIGAKYADCILIETMSDSYELKAAVLAAKENCDLPIFATVIFDGTGKLLTGGNVISVSAMLEGLGVTALGVNCGLGPRQLSDIVRDLTRYTSLPIIVNPNAGLPRVENGRTVFDVSPEEFARDMVEIATSTRGAVILGGCCGTTPAHIKAMIAALNGTTALVQTVKDLTIVASGSKAVIVDEMPLIVGERINPTGKSKFKQALRDHNIEYILNEGLTQEEHGAHILDVNVGLPEIDEVEMLTTAVRELQSVTTLPLQIDTTNLTAMDQALRVYNGKALINSVNGKQEMMDAIFPLVKKYGGVVVALALDESGIPATSEGRLAIARKIYDTAASYGIDRKDIVIDALTMTISTDDHAALATLETVKAIHDDFHGHTILGVSNISFGLPRRDLLNSSFYTSAMEAGLSLGIINPNAQGMKTAYDTFVALHGFDSQCTGFIEAYANTAAPTVAAAPAQGTAAPTPAKDASAPALSPLMTNIVKGLKDAAAKSTRALLESGEKDSLAIINEELVPALDIVGKGFEKGTIFLPQLLMSAEATKESFEVIKGYLQATGVKQENKGTIVMATVKGDIHDIGKNIVKVLLENYGYNVIDLGKDVAPERVVETVRTSKAPLVGLSALMTTTVVSMEETIRQLHEAGLPCKVMVGGAVLTQEYADRIKADKYCKDAMMSVHYAEQLFGHES